MTKVNILEHTPEARKTCNFLIATPLSHMEYSGIKLGLRAEEAEQEDRVNQPNYYS